MPQAKSATVSADGTARHGTAQGKTMTNAKKIEEFLEEWKANRGRGPDFVGREREIGHILGEYDATCRQLARGDLPRKTISLVMAPPGMGKTSLLQEAEEKLVERIARDFGKLRFRPMVVDADTEHLRSKERFNDRCREYLKEKSRISRYGGRAARMAIKSLSAFGFDLSATAEEIDALARELFDERPFIVALVDEVQSADDSNADVFKAMHTGKMHPPVIPVFTGLSDSKEVLEGECRLTRIEPSMTLNMQMLDKTQTAELVDSRLDALEIAPESPQRIRDFVFEDTEGFPRHIHSVLYEIADRARTDPKLGENAIGQVRQAEQEKRTAYYAERASKMDRGEKKTADAIVKALRPQGEGGDAAQIATQCLAAHRLGRAAPTGDDGRRFLSKLLRIGILQSEPDGRYTDAIPSFASWLERECKKLDNLKPTPGALTPEGGANYAPENPDETEATTSAGR